MSTKYTPGPWVAEKADQFGDHNIILGNAVEVGDYRAVAAVVSNMRNPEVVEANARLIAAAPELLEALKAFMPEFDQRERFISANDSAWSAAEHQILDRIRRARAALAKAEAQP